MNNAEEVRGTRTLVTATAAVVIGSLICGATTPAQTPLVTSPSGCEDIESNTSGIEYQPPPLPAPTQQQVDARCEIIEYGPYIAVTERHHFSDEQSVTGVRFETELVEFGEPTTAITMRLGEAFGIRYRADRVPTGATVTHRVVYPTRLRGFTDWRHDIGEQSPGEEAHIGYYFDHDYEMVAGRWEFQVLVDGKKACGLAFTVSP